MPIRGPAVVFLCSVHSADPDPQVPREVHRAGAIPFKKDRSKCNVLRSQALARWRFAQRLMARYSFKIDDKATARCSDRWRAKPIM
jgi:hypothetical protein